MRRITRLYRSAAGAELFAQIGGEIGATAYVDSGLDANTSYEYELEVCNDNGCSARSAAFSATTALGMPTAGLTATAQSASEISIAWSAVADATHYKLYRSEAGVGSFAQIGGEIGATVYVDSGLDANTSYDYELEACNDNGCSGRSAAVSATTALGMPMAGLTAAAQNASEISITWSAIADATHYKLYRSEAGVGSFAQIGGEIGATVYVDSGLDANTSYDYELEACNDNGCSARSAAVSATTALGMPTAGLTATAQSASEISIAWSAVADATHYKLYRSEAGVGSFAQIGGEIGATVYVDSGLDANTSYDYELEACNDNGCSARSAAVSATTALGMPTAGLTATAQSASEISIAWSAVADATHYKLYRSEAGVGSFAQIGGEIGATVYVDSGLDANTSYDYELEACNDNGCSARSAAVSATTALGMPTAGLTATAQSASAISISWSAVADATHYKLYRSAAGAELFAQIGGEIGATDYVDDNGLAANTSYDYELEACNGSGCSGRSSAVSATTALGRPTAGLTATTQSASAISITWSAVADATHYKLYRSAVGAGLFAQIGGDIGATLHVDSGLEANTSYDYELEACNGNGCSGRSAAVSATTALGRPTSGLSATAQSASEISLSWSAVADATHYKLYRSAAGVGLFAQIGNDIAATVYVDSGLDANTSYDYKLEACNDNGCSGRSAAVSATTAPGRPSALTAAAQSESAISISWSAVAGATHYKLYRSATSEGSFDQIGGEIAATDYVDDNDLAANTSYYYQLAACNGNGCSSRSSAVSATTAPETPETPTVETQNEGAVSISWSAVAGATHYKLYRSATSGGPFAQIGGEIAGTDYVDDSGLAASTSYYYQLAACSGSGCSSRSSAVSATTAPERPSALTVAAQSEGAISITWSAVAGATYYKLYRSETSEGLFSLIGDDIAGTVYVDSGLDANTFYDYQLESCNDNGCSGRSPEVSATTAPERPSALTVAAQSEGAISITWSAVAGATYYKLYRSETSGGQFDLVGDNIAATDYVDSGLAASAPYYYQLEACNGGGCSGRSPEVSATTVPSTPATPRAATQSDSEISIKWSAVAGATHYKLYRSETSEESFAQIGRDIAATDYVDNNALAANTSYYYQLESCNSGGCSGRSSEVSATTAPATPATPRAATQSDSEISIKWSAVAGATHYKLYRSETSRGLFAQIEGEITATGYLDSNLSESTPYYYQLEACNDNGCSGRSSEVSAATYATGSLGAGRDEITGLPDPRGIAFSGGRAYVADITLGKIISYSVEVNGELGAGRDEIATGLSGPNALAFSGGRAYVADGSYPGKIISYPVGADGILGAPRDEITTGLEIPQAIAFLGGRAYVADRSLDKIISYPVGARGELGAGRDEITNDFRSFRAWIIAFSGGRAYVVDWSKEAGRLKIISYAVEADGRLSAVRDEIAIDSTSWAALAFSGGRAYVVDGRKIISYPVGADGILGARRDEINSPLRALAFSGGRVYVGDYFFDKIISYPLFSSVAFTVAPDAPRVVAQSESEIEIAWNAVLGATHYKLYRSETSGGLFAQVGIDISITRYRDGNFPANTSYYYQLKACSGDECSEHSPEVSTTTAPPIPSTPTAATQSDSAISITWSAVAGATHYNLYRSETSDGLFAQIGGEIAAIDYVDNSGLSANTSYYYQLESCNGGGCSGRSPEVSATTAPATPSALSAGAQSGGAVSVVWSEVAGATYYKLYRSDASGGLFAQIGGEIAATAYVDNDIFDNTSYYYQLESCNGNGCSGRSPEVSATTAPAIPSAPTAATQSDRAISIKWSAVAGATYYNLYRSETGEGEFDRVGDNIAATDYVDGGLAVNTSYDYQLEACNDNGCSGRSPIGSATTAPAIPTPTAAAQSDSAISISWSEVAGATHYKLYRATVSGGAYTQIGGDIDALGYLNGDLSETTAYYYQLESCNGGGCSGRSPEVSDTTYAAGSLGAGRDEITTGLDRPSALAFSGGRAYMVDSELDKIISYAVEAGGSLGEARDEITAGLSHPSALAFSGGRAYVADFSLRKIISYPVEAGGELGAGRDEITTGLSGPLVLAFSGERAYVADTALDKIISYPVEAGGVLGLGRDEVTTGLSSPRAIVFSGGRAYVANYDFSGDEDKIISYPVEAGGELGEARDEITTGLSFPSDLAFSGGRAYVTDAGLDKIISYPVETGGILGAVRDEITTGLSGPSAIAFSGGRAYVAESVFDKIISYPLFSSVPFAVAPDAPRVVAQSEIEIAWNAVLGATHYKLYRSETSGGLFAQVGGDISITRYLDGGFSASIYYYQLEACSGDECSDRSPAVKTAPAAPTAAAQSDSAVSITWSAVAGATHYKLYRSETSGEGFAQIGGEITATGYFDGGLSVKIAYYYRLEACNSGGCSGRSPEISVASGSLGVGRDEITTDLLRPHALAFSGGRAYAVDVDFSGNKNHKIISYPVEADGELGARRDEITTGLSFPFALAFSGGRVYVVDADFSGDGNKIISYPVEADGELGARRDEITTGLDRPEAIAFSGGRAYVADYILGKIISYPVGVGGELGAGRDEAAAGLFGARAIAFSGGRAYVADDRTGKIISYPVEADGELGVGRDEITTGLSRPRALAFSGGRAYVADDRLRKIISYPVGSGGILGAGRDEAAAGLNRPEAIAFSGRRAYVGSGNKIISYPLFSSVPFAVAPDAPRVVVQRDNEIEIAWNAVLGATHYKLYRSESSGGLFALIEGDISITRYRDGNLSENTAYYYQLEACNGDECSGRSPEVSAVTRYSLPATPLIPTAAAQSDGAISIAWSAVAGATYYNLYRSETSGGQFDLVGGNIAATDYVDSGLAASVPYYYQLEACNSGGCSGRSAEVSATTVPTTPLIPTAAAQSDSAISIKWSAVAGATYYNLYRSETSGGQFDLVDDNIAATDYVDSGLAASAPYYYQLEACNGGGCSGRSPEVSATTVPTTPLIPTAAAQSDSEISIKWSAVTGATHYNLYRATASGGAYMQIGGEIVAIGYLDGDLSESTAYYYQLEVCNSGGCSGRSPEVSATTYATGSLGAGRDEIATGLNEPSALAFSGGRAYVTDSNLDKIISYPVGAGGELGAGRDEITTSLDAPQAIAFSGGRAYVADSVLDKIISYPVGARGELGAGRDEITIGSSLPGGKAWAIAFSGGRAYVADWSKDGKRTEIISYAVGADGILGAARDEILTDSNLSRVALAFSGGRVYMVGSDKFISYPVGANGILGARRDEITDLHFPRALAFSGGRAYVADTGPDKIISYPAGSDGRLSAGRDEITAGLSTPRALAFSGGRAYVADTGLNKIISYPLFSSVAFAVAPDTPRVFAQSESEIEIAWNAVLGATHYKLYRSETSGGTFAQVGLDISITRYQDSGLSVKTSYYYQLEACSGDECSGRSPEVSTSTYGSLGAGRDEITIGLDNPSGIAFSGGRAYVVNTDLNKIISYPAGSVGILGAGRDEITTGLDYPVAIAFSGGRVYVTDTRLIKIISYPVGADGILGAGRDEITPGLGYPIAIAFFGDRIYVADYTEIISYPVGSDGELGAGRDEVTIGLDNPRAIAFSGGRAYVTDINLDKIISYPVGSGGILGAGRDEITIGLESPLALAFSGGRVYVADSDLDKIISYPTGSGGILGAGRDEITIGLESPLALAFFGDRVYVAIADFSGDEDKIVSYPLFSSIPFAVAPDAPRVIAQSESESEIEIAWSAVLGATHYKLYRSETSDGTFTQVEGDISITRYRDGGLSANIFYYYQLEACNGDECSDLSPTARVAPAPTATTQSDTEISITWSAVAGATHYKLYRATVGGGPYTRIEGNIVTTGYYDSGLSADTAYYYRLEACNSGGCSGRSFESVAMTYGSLGAGRDEIAAGLNGPKAIAFSGGRIYVADFDFLNNAGKIISYSAGAGGTLSAGRDEITTGLRNPTALAFSGGRAYVTDFSRDKIISYPVGAGGILGAGRDEITTGLDNPSAIAFSGGRAYVVDSSNRIISYPVGLGGILGTGREEIRRGLNGPSDIAFFGGRAYVTDLVDIFNGEYKIVSYPVEAGGILGAGREEVTAGSVDTPLAIAFSGGRAYVVDRFFANIISYPVGADGRLGAERDEMAAGLMQPNALAFSGGRVYVTDRDLKKIFSYPLLSSAAFAVAPDAPRVVAQSDSAASITWNAVLGATHYKLYRSKTSDGLFAQVGGDISITRYRDGGLAGNTSYDYQLEACNSGGCSGRSPAGSVTTAPAIPSAPAAAAQSNSAVSIAWSAVAGATHYNLYRSDASGGLFTRIGGEIAATDYVDSDLDANTSYYYRLEACNDNGCSGRSPVDSATTAPLPPPTPSTPSAAAQSDTEISIVWSEVAGATHYNLYRATVSGGTYMQIGGDIAATDYLDSNLSETTAYYYQLEACNSGGCSGRSPEVSAATYATGSLGAGRDEIMTGLSIPRALAFSGGRAYVAESFYDNNRNLSVGKIISYPVGVGGELGAGRDEITTGLNSPFALAFSGGRAYVTDTYLDKIISYPVGVGGELGAGRDEITTGLSVPRGIAFSDGWAYVLDGDLSINEDKIISYPVGAGGELGAGRDEITTVLDRPALAFSGGRAYVADYILGKIISYPVEAGGELGAGRDEITTGNIPRALAFSGGRAYGAALDEIVSYPVGAGGELGAGRDEITTGLDNLRAIAFSGGRAYVGDFFRNKIISYPVFSSVAFAVAPDAPRVFAQSESEIEIAWNAVLGATHYKLYRSETSGGTFAQIGLDISITRYRDGNFPANTSYYYQLEACSGDECSEHSPEVSTTTAPPIPSTPTAATQSDSAISIKWSAVAGATHYNLYRSETSDGLFARIGVEIAATDYVDGGLSANTSYYYQLESCNGGGCSGRSPVGSATTALATPSNLLADARSGGAVFITWNTVAGATHYNLYRSETSGGSFARIGGEIATIVYRDSDITENTSYYYQLESCNGNGCSGRSPEVSVTTAPAIPSAPTAATQNNGAISIKWSAVAEATHYKLYRSETSEGQFDRVGDNIAATDYVDSDLDANTSYYYRLEACNDNGCSGRSPIGSAITTPAIPMPTATAQSDTEISIVWSEVAGATHYNLYRSETSGGLFAQIGGEITAIGYLDSGLSETTAYYYQLEACNGGGCSGRSPEVSATTYATGSLGAGRDEITAGLDNLNALAFSGGRAYVVYLNNLNNKIISYPVGADGILGAGRDEITTGLSYPRALAFSGGRAYVADNGTSGNRFESKIISYPVGAGGELGAGRDEITTGLSVPFALAFSGGRAYVANRDTPGNKFENKIISYPVGAGGILGVGRDEITIGLFMWSRALAFSGGRAYVAETLLDKIISYPVGTGGELGAGRDEITTGLDEQRALAFSGGRAYVVDRLSGKGKIISYPVGAGGELGAPRDEITTSLSVPLALAFSGGRAYVADQHLDKIISYPVFSSVAFAVAPDAPRVFAQSDSEIEIAWNAVLGATHYKLYRSDTSGGTFAQVGIDISITRYLNDNLSENTSYYYQLEACSGDECSGRSPEVSVTTAPMQSTPTAATQNNGAISIVWSAVAGATHYKLYRSETNDGSFMQIGGEITATDYVDSNLDANTSYYYRLEVCNDNGCSGRSPIGSAITTPATPAMPTATAQSDTEISIVWSEVAGVTHYNLYRATVSGRAYMQIGGDIATTGYLDSGLSEATPYYYQLESCNGGECSGRSPEVSTTTYAEGSLGAGRDEVTTGLNIPQALAFSGGRAYVADDDGAKIISYPVGADGELGAGRDEITTGLSFQFALAFSGGLAYVADYDLGKIISYPVGAGGELGAPRDEVIIGLNFPIAIAFSGGRAYVVDFVLDKIISYPVGAGGILGAGRDEITTGLPQPRALAFSGGRAYVADTRLDKIISYPVGAGGELGAGRDEITTGLSIPEAIVFSGGRAYVANPGFDKIISYPVGTGGELGAGRDEITGLNNPYAIAFSGGRAYVADRDLDRIISYPLFSSVAFAVVPDAPRVFAQSESEIEIAWNAVLGATHYKLYRSETSGGLFAQVEGDISITRYLDDNLSTDTSYYYQLEACSGDECSEHSPEVSVDTRSLGAGRDEITIGLSGPVALAFAGGRAYVGDYDLGKIISYPVGAGGILGAGRDEITTGLDGPAAIAFSGGRAYVADYDLGKIISYPVGAGGILDVGRDEITTGLSNPRAIAFAGGRAYVADYDLGKIISYPVGAGGELGAGRDEAIGLNSPQALAFSGGRAYVADSGRIISYSVRAGGILGAGRDEITTGLSIPHALAFSGGRVYVTDEDLDKIISYSVGASGILGAGRDEITAGLSFPVALVFSNGRAYVADFDLDKIISYPVFSSVASADASDAPRVFAQSESGIEIAWNAVLEATHYKLYRSETSDGTYTQIGGDISITRYQDDFSANIYYYYQLEVCIGDECSERSPAVRTAPDALRVATQNDSEISIKWSAIAGATHYKLYRATVSGGAYTQIEGNIDALDYLDDNLSETTEYYYQLEVCNSGGCSGRSPEVSATTYATGSLGAGRNEITALPNSAALAFSGGRVYVADEDLDKIISYPVGAGGELGAGRDEITGLNDPSALAFSGGRAYVVDSGLDKIISYPVEADGRLGAGRDEITTGLYSPTAIAFSGGRAYVADINFIRDFGFYNSKIISYPVEADGELGAGRDEITGLDVPRALAFSGGRVYVADSFFEKITSYPVDADGRLGAVRDEITTIDLNNPRALAFSGGRSYVADSSFDKIISYPVDADGRLGAGRDEITAGLDFPRALAFSGGRLYVADSSLDKITSYPVFSSVAFAVAPDAPRVFAQSESEIEIAWNAVLGATHYKLYRSETSGGTFAQVGVDISITRHRDDNLSADTSYYYQLEACSGDECSGSSPEVSVTTAPTQSTPTAATQNNGAISIKWSAVAGATYYKLYRSETNDGSFMQIGGEITATDYVDSDLDANTSYYYRLEACNDNGCSGRSPVGSAITTPATPATPTATAQSDTEISIVWSEVAGATHYNLYRATVSGGAYMQIGGDIATTGYLDSNLPEATPYYYQLEACNSGGCSGRSPEVLTTTYAEGSLGAGRDEITTGLDFPRAIAFSGGRAYVADDDGAKIISYPVGADGELGAGRDEITTGLPSPRAIAFSGGRAYVADDDGAKIISYPVGADGELGAGRDEITTGLPSPRAIAFSGGRAYVADDDGAKIISYPVGADGELGAGRDEITTGLPSPRAIAFSGGRAYVADRNQQIISYPVDVNGRLGDGREEITSGLAYPLALAFSGSRAYVADLDFAKIISYPVGADGRLSAGRDEITTGLSQRRAIAFSDGRAYVVDNGKIISYPVFSSVAFAVAPDAPRVFTQNDSEIEIAWNAVLGATHYKLYRSETSGGTFAQVGVDISITRYLDDNLPESASYYYQLEACSGDDCSGRSPEVSAATYATGSLGAGRDEITIGLSFPGAISFSGGRAYVADRSRDRIISYPVGASGELGAGRDEITTDLFQSRVIAFSGGRAYVTDEIFHKIISYPVEAGGILGAGRDEITTGLDNPNALAFSGGRAYVTDPILDKIISYPVGADGILGAGRDEITTGLTAPVALAFSGGRAYVIDALLEKIISYPVGAGGELGAGRDEITTGLDNPSAFAFLGGRAYVGNSDLDKIISYPVEADGSLGAERDEITTGLGDPQAIAFSGGRAYVGDYALDKIISYPRFSSVAFAVAPDAPRVFTQNESEIEIAWNAVLGATHYKLYRSETSGGLFAQVEGDISITRYRDGNLPANTSYYYQLEACSGDECSGRSPEVSTTTAPPVSSMPAAATQNDGAISITWSAVAGATHYNLYRATASGGAYMQIGGEIAATGYLDSGLSETSAYYYQLEVCNDNGCSGRSPQVSAATYATGSLGAGRDEITGSGVFLRYPFALAFSGGRAYVAEADIVSYPVGSGGELGARRDEITTGLSFPLALAFSGGRAYVVDSDKIVSYPVGAGESWARSAMR